MHRKCASLVGCLVTFLLLLGAFARAEIVARCGQGYLETIDGYRVLAPEGDALRNGLPAGHAAQ